MELSRNFNKHSLTVFAFALIVDNHKVGRSHRRYSTVRQYHRLLALSVCRKRHRKAVGIMRIQDVVSVCAWGRSIMSLSHHTAAVSRYIVFRNSFSCYRNNIHDYLSLIFHLQIKCGTSAKAQSWCCYRRCRRVCRSGMSEYFCTVTRKAFIKYFNVTRTPTFERRALTTRLLSWRRTRCPGETKIDCSSRSQIALWQINMKIWFLGENIAFPRNHRLSFAFTLIRSNRSSPQAGNQGDDESRKSDSASGGKMIART